MRRAHGRVVARERDRAGERGGGDGGAATDADDADVARPTPGARRSLLYDRKAAVDKSRARYMRRSGGSRARIGRASGGGGDDDECDEEDEESECGKKKEKEEEKKEEEEEKEEEAEKQEEEEEEEERRRRRRRRSKRGRGRACSPLSVSVRHIFERRCYSILFYSVINLNQFCEFSRSLFSVDARSCASPTPEELARRAPLDFADDAGAAL